MRITDALLFDRTRRDIAGNADAAAQAQHVASTGLAVEHPGDDPAAASLVARNGQAEARYRAIGQAAGRASDELQTVDGALGTASNLLARAQELAVQLSNGTCSTAQRASGATEVHGLIQQLAATLNVQSGGRYLLGGAADRAPPFAADGTYSGDAAVRTLEIAPGVSQASSVRADAAFKGAGGGVDVFATLQALRGALAADDPAGVASALDPLRRATDQLAGARAEAGVAMDAFDAAATASSAAADAVKVQTGHLADADLADAATRLAAAQRALEASYAAGAQGFRLTLLSYLS